MTEVSDTLRAKEDSMTDLAKHEMELLRDLNGEATAITGWGSWMADAAGALRSRGFVTPMPNVQITAKGRAFVAEEKADD